MPEKEEREKGREEIFEGIMPKHFPKLMTDTKAQIHEAQIIPSRKTLWISYSRCRKNKDKEENLERSQREKSNLPIKEQG